MLSSMALSSRAYTQQLPCTHGRASPLGEDMLFALGDSPYSILFSYMLATEQGQIHQEKAALPPETFHSSPRGENLAQHEIKRGITSDSAKVVSLGIT